jgi:predicted DNA-binding protein (MmcQ/YjbR family)
MNTLHLNKTELEDILEFVNKYPDVHMATLHWNSSSGIGKTLTAEIRTYLKDDYVSVTKTITEQTSW